jgi:hypothetical protein
MVLGINPRVVPHSPVAAFVGTYAFDLSGRTQLVQVVSDGGFGTSKGGGDFASADGGLRGEEREYSVGDRGCF